MYNEAQEYHNPAMDRVGRVMRYYDNSSWAWQEIFVKWGKICAPWSICTLFPVYRLVESKQKWSTFFFFLFTCLELDHSPLFFGLTFVLYPIFFPSFTNSWVMQFSVLGLTSRYFLPLEAISFPLTLMCCSHLHLGQVVTFQGIR